MTKVEETLVPDKAGARLNPVKMKVGKISRDGVIEMEFNQRLLVPDFIKEAQAAKGRDLNLALKLQDIDVSREIVEFKFILNSDHKPEDIKYILEIVQWTANKLKLHINFTNPLAVSTGQEPDQVRIIIRNR